jgi:plasmid stabilization system protein ParE
MPPSQSCKSVARTLQSGVADQAFTVELTDSFLERLDSIEAFLAEAEALFAFDELLAELRAKVIPNLKRFPRIGRRYLDQPPQSAEALAQLAELPSGAADALREYLHGDYLILYALAESTAYLLSIRHHRQLTYDFARLWPSPSPSDAGPAKKGSK